MNARPLLLLVTLGAASCTPGLAQDHIAQAPVDSVAATRARLTIAPVRTATTRSLVHLPAEVVVPDTARFHLTPPLDGLLERVDVEIGSLIAEGAPLAAVRSPELIAVGASESEWRQVARDRDRFAEQLEAHVASGFSSAVPLYEAQLAADEAEASASRARRERQAISAWVPDPATDGTWAWQSPVSGVVTDVHCSIGSRVSAGETCVDVVDTSAAEVVVHVPERYLTQIDAGVSLVFHPSSGAAPQTLSYRRLAPTLDPMSRTRAVYFDATDDEAPMAVGASGRGELVASTTSTAYAVPTGAVTDMEGVDVIFVDHDSASLPSAVAVEVVGRHGTDLIITSADLAPDAEIVEAGAFLLKSIALLGSES